MLKIRPMVSTDLKDLDLLTHGHTVRGHVAEEDGVPVAATGVLHTDPFYAFAQMSDEMRKHPRDVVRVIRGFENFLGTYYKTVYAVADVDESNAPAVLRRAGFKYYQTNTQGDIYVWNKQEH